MPGLDAHLHVVAFLVRRMDFHVERHHVRAEYGTHVLDVTGNVAVEVFVHVAFEERVPAFVVVQVYDHVNAPVVALEVYLRVALHQGPEFADPRLQGEVVLGFLRLRVEAHFAVHLYGPDGRYCGRNLHWDPVLGLLDFHVHLGLYREQVVFGRLHVELYGVLAGLYISLHGNVLAFEVRVQVDACRFCEVVALYAVELDECRLCAAALDGEVLGLPVHCLFASFVHIDGNFPDACFHGQVELYFLGEGNRFHRVFLLVLAACIGASLYACGKFPERKFAALVVAQYGNVEREILYGVHVVALLNGDGIPGMREQATEFVAVRGNFHVSVGVRVRHVGYQGNTRKPGAQGKNANNDRHDCGGQCKCRSTFLQRA